MKHLNPCNRFAIKKFNEYNRRWWHNEQDSDAKFVDDLITQIINDFNDAID